MTKNKILLTIMTGAILLLGSTTANADYQRRGRALLSDVCTYGAYGEAWWREPGNYRLVGSRCSLPNFGLLGRIGGW